MKAYGIDVSGVSKAQRPKDSIHCFLELHVEQGASLDKKGIPVGVVSSIAGVSAMRYHQRRGKPRRKYGDE